MPRPIWTVLLAIVATTVMSHPATAGTHKDEKLGFSINPPKRWRDLPVSDQERWIVAKFQSERLFSPRKEFGFSHRPEMMVVIIPLDAGGAKVKRDEKGVKVQLRNPYKDFHDYMEKNVKEAFGSFGDGGFYFSEEKETTIHGAKVIQYEVTFDKLTDNPRRVFGWAFYADDCIYGVMADCLIEWEKKVKPDIMHSFKSFRMFARTGSLPSGTSTGDGVSVETDEDSGRLVTDEEIEKRRRDLTKRRLDRITEGLDKDWYVRKSKNFIAVSHADKRYTKELLDHAEALRRWLDDTLGFIGSGYVGKTIIRICEDEHEANGYTSSIPWTSIGRIEVVTYKDREGWSDWAMESLNRGLFGIWVRDKNRELLWSAPSWLRTGIEGLVENAKSKRGRVEFEGDTWESVRLKELRRDERIPAAREFFELTNKDLWEREGASEASVAFVRFLLVGSGSRSSKYKSIIQDYTKSLIFLLDEQAAADEEMKKLAEEQPTTEEEEDALFRKRKEAWDKRETDRLTALRERTFDGWDDGDWDKLSAAFLRELK